MGAVMTFRIHWKMSILNLKIFGQDLENSLSGHLRIRVCRHDNSSLTCGVRQVEVLSPVLFAFYVNDIIEKLNQSSHGCRIGDT